MSNIAVYFKLSVKDGRIDLSTYLPASFFAADVKGLSFEERMSNMFDFVEGAVTTSLSFGKWFRTGELRFETDELGNAKEGCLGSREPTVEAEWYTFKQEFNVDAQPWTITDLIAQKIENKYRGL